MSKNFELTAYSNCSREFTLDIDGVLIEVQREIPTGIDTRFALFVFVDFPLGKDDFLISDWLLDAKFFLSQYKQHIGEKRLVTLDTLHNAPDEVFSDVLGPIERVSVAAIFTMNPIKRALFGMRVESDAEAFLVRDEILSLATEKGNYKSGSVSADTSIAEFIRMQDLAELSSDLLGEAQQQLREHCQAYQRLTSQRLADQSKTRDFLSQQERIWVESKLQFTQENEMLNDDVSRLRETMRKDQQSRLMYEADMWSYFKRGVDEDTKKLMLEELFDEKDYKTKYSLGPLSAYFHYQKFGWKRGCTPGPMFDSEYYLAQVGQSLEQLKRSPLDHYLNTENIKLTSPTPYFEPEWYLREYPDVLKSNMPSFLHFMLYGWKEGRKPSVLFDTNWYNATYSDVALSGVNPLVHYVVFGKGEGRRATSGE